MLPFAYCLQADKDVMLDTVLAGPSGIVGEDSFDPFCHLECQPDIYTGAYNMDLCMSCYKDEDNLDAIVAKYESAGGSYRTRPTNEQIISCLDTYLPTLLTGEVPEIIQTWENDTDIAGYITGTVHTDTN